MAGLLTRACGSCRAEPGRLGTAVLIGNPLSHQGDHEVAHHATMRDRIDTNHRMEVVLQSHAETPVSYSEQ